jgi:ParB family chromosome partitioning protein
LTISTLRDVVSEVPIERILPDLNQPRKYFNERSINELAESIRNHGLLQPILVRPKSDGTYQIVHGERRFRACIVIKLSSVKCLVKELSDSEAADIQLIENLERNDLADIELAGEFKRRVDNGQTHSQIAEIIGKTRTFVTQRLALLHLSQEEQDRILRGELSFSNARQLLSIKDVSLRMKVSQQISSETTVAQMAMIKQEENVTRVTPESPDEIEVEQLATYKLLSNQKTVPSTAFLAAVGKDLKFLRGEA